MIELLATIELLPALAATGLATTSSFLRGFQNKNVVAGFKGLTFGTGFLMGMLDVLAIALIAKTGVLLAVFYGLGMGLGYLVSIIVHERMTRKREKERKKRRKTKMALRIEDTVNSILLEHELIRKTEKGE